MRGKLTASSDSQRERMLAERAFAMRKAPTTSEAWLFEAVRGDRLGVAFRRQVPLLGRYIVDLLAPELRLVVEIDGGAHVGRERADARRDRALERAGYRVVHVAAQEVIGDLDAAVARVRKAIVDAGRRGEIGWRSRLPASATSRRAQSRARAPGMLPKPRYLHQLPATDPGVKMIDDRVGKTRQAPPIQKKWEPPVLTKSAW